MSKRPNRKSVPNEIQSAHIESFAHDGRGVSHIGTKATFITGALPGEQVEFRYTDIRRDFAEGRTVNVLQPSPLRVQPLCSKFGICGGCSLQHLETTAQIEAKQALMLEQFRRIGKVNPETLFPPLIGPHWGYRNKARLGVKWVPKKQKVLVGFREQSSAFLADIESCPVLHPQVGERLAAIGDMIAGLSIRDRLPQIEVAVGDDRSALVFRVLDQPSPSDLERLRQFGTDFGFDIYLQPKGPDSVFSAHPEQAEWLTYRLDAQNVQFRFKPTDFTQVNMAINRQLIDRVMKVLDPQPHETVLDLFCGLGNFTLPIARLASHVTGIEGSCESVERARMNAELNGISNAEFYMADLSQPVDDFAWARRAYDKVLLDPSRAGAQEILGLIPQWQPKHIVYVSCNPSTLARDIGILVHDHGYRLLQAGVMDMFPHTAHVESIALLEK